MVGEHTREILEWLGYSQADMDELKAEGDRMVGDDIAEEGIRYLQTINFGSKKGAALLAAE